MIRSITILTFILASALSFNAYAIDIFKKKVELGPLCTYEVARLKSDEEMKLPTVSGLVEAKGYRHSGGIEYSATYARYNKPGSVSGAIDGSIQSLRVANALVSGIRCYGSVVPRSTGQQCEANVTLGKKKYGLIFLVIRSLRHPQVLCTFQALYDKSREKYDKPKALDFVNSANMIE